VTASVLVLVLLVLAVARLIQLEVRARRAAREARMHRELVSSMSHELRTPITTIKGFVELIAEGDAGPVTETQREFLEITARSADRLSVLVNDLLESGGRPWRESS
jgi:signal transduction histidine kinase